VSRPHYSRARIAVTKDCVHFSICACHPCAGAMIIFSVSFQFYLMIPEGNPKVLAIMRVWNYR